MWSMCELADCTVLCEPWKERKRRKTREGKYSIPMIRIRSDQLGSGAALVQSSSRAFIGTPQCSLARRRDTNIIARAKRERLPGQAETVLNPTDSAEELLARMPTAMKSYSDLDYLAVGAVISAMFQIMSLTRAHAPPM